MVWVQEFLIKLFIEVIVALYALISTFKIMAIITIIK